MGAVGINFGSATSGAGFDVTATVASIVTNLQTVESPWKTQLTTLKAADTAFTTIGTDLSSLSTSLGALTDFQGVLAAKQGSSSNTDVLALSSAGPTATAGSHTIVVSQLAQTSSNYSDAVPPQDTLSGALTIQVGAGAATTIPVVGGTSDTLASYAAAINFAGIGVTASVISDTTGSRLSLVSNSSGLAGQLTVTSGGTEAPVSTPTDSATSVASDTSTPASNTFALGSSTDRLSGTFSYQVGSAPAAMVDLGTTPLGLTDTAATLNGDTGFAASGLIATVSGAQLIITGSTGASGAANIDTSGSSLVTTPLPANYGALTDTTDTTSTTATSAGTPVLLQSGLDGQDALLTVDGIHVDSASNTVSTAIPGVTFQLLSAPPSTQVQVQITNDNTTAETAFASFVAAYNTVVGDIKTQEGNDSSGNPEPLFGNTILSQLQSSLSLSLTSGAASGGIGDLSQLGISVNNDGTLQLNSSQLDSALNSNYGDVIGFMQNSGSFGQNLVNVLDQVGNQSPTGAITLALRSNATEESTLNDDVTNQEALIATQKTNLTAQLNLANETLQGIPQQLNEVNELYSALTGFNTGSGN